MSHVSDFASRQRLLLDRQWLDRFQHKSRGLQQLLHDFKELAGAMPAQLRQRIATNDYPGLREQLHGLKSVCQNIGAQAVGALCLESEDLQLDEFKARAPTLVNELEALLTQTLTALEQYRQRLAQNGNPASSIMPETPLSRLLLVEDHAGIRQWVRTIVEPHYALSEATNGAEAIHLSQGPHPPDLLILDLNLGRPDAPEQRAFSGLDVARELAPLPFVVLTVDRSPETRRTAINAGAWGFIVKPPEPDNLLSAIEVALARGRERRDCSQVEVINQAIGILMAIHHVNHHEAFRSLRFIANRDRSTLQQAANQIRRVQTQYNGLYPNFSSESS